ncbi:MAG TPA: O-antigen ligase family protein [Candidatus Hydrogenedentes bacterium]|nr:O-antigen ligase family protein [Candidatus Hydrogenedentota bacterium]
MDPLDSSWQAETFQDRVERARLGLLCAIIILCAAAYSFHLTSFLHAKEAVLSLGVVVLAGLALARGGISYYGVGAFLPLWCMLLLSVALATAHVASREVEEALRIGTLLLASALSFDMLAYPSSRVRVLRALILSGALVAALGLVQYANLLPTFFPRFPGYNQRMYSVFGNQDLFGGYLAMAFALLMTELEERDGAHRGIGLWPLWFVGVLTALFLTGLLLSGSRSAWLAAFVGAAAAFPWKRISGSRTLRFLVLAVTVIVVVATPLWPHLKERVAQTFSSGDVGGRARLWFWDGAMRMIHDFPVSGVGLGNFAYWSPRYLGEALNAPGGETHYFNELVTTEAHSELLHYVAETGVVGAVFGLWMLARLARKRDGAWGGLVALLVFSLFNAAWHSAPHALAGLLLAGTLLHPKQWDWRKQEAGRPVNGAVFLLLSIVFAAGAAWCTFFPSYLQCRAEAVHCAGGDPLPLYERVFAHRWPNAECREEYGMALLDRNRPADAYIQLQLALEGVDTGRAHLLLGLAAERLGQMEDARVWFSQCLARWPSNYEAWSHLMALSPPEDWDRLIEHSRRWNIHE